MTIIKRLLLTTSILAVPVLLIAQGQAQAPVPAVGPDSGQGGLDPALIYKPLRRILLHRGVAQTLFDEYAEHRRTDRSEEETGWLLLGQREEEQAIIRATLPAGADREAGEAHVRFNSTAHAVASRIARQADRRLALLGVVHTHPGSLRHPSDGDFRGDIRWVGQLRGAEGVFAIGTADGEGAEEIEQPRASVQRLAQPCNQFQPR